MVSAFDADKELLRQHVAATFPGIVVIALVRNETKIVVLWHARRAGRSD